MPPLKDESAAPEKSAAGAASAMTTTTTTTTTKTTTKTSTTTDNTNDATAVPVTAIAMKLLDVSLKSTCAIVKSVLGDFMAVVGSSGNSGSSGSSGNNKQSQQQQICVARASAMELYSLPSLTLLKRIETHSIIRDMVAIRWTGEQRDLVGIVSDSGAWTLLDWNDAAAIKPQVTVFGKTACRRATPGHYIASDPKGRAVLVSALEKRKLVYVLNHHNAHHGDSSSSGGTSKATTTTTTTTTTRTHIASPLEAHRARTLVFATTGVDNGYDNPIFAVLEQEYPDDDDDYDNEDHNDEDNDAATPTLPPKELAYYELDLGLNHVSRTWAMPVPATACCLASLPGGADGPSGVLVGSENYISYYHVDLEHPIHCVVPQRKLEPTNRPLLVTQLTVHKQKKAKFFGLGQSELGDVYKISLELTENNNNNNNTAGTMQVVGMHVAVLDTLPPCTSLNISKKGLLFGPTELGGTSGGGAHALYQFERIDLPNAPSNHSDDLGNMATMELAQLTTEHASKLAQRFTPRGTLENLIKVARLENATPTTGLLVGELAGQEVSPQIYTLGGTGPTSQLSILRHGASVTELALSELPGIPGGIFTIADDTTSPEKAYSKYIVVSFADATLVLSVGDTVEEVGRESGFLTNAPTLACSALKDGSLCQIHPSGVRHIQRGQAKQWHCPGLKRIECASSNLSQVLIALAGGEVTYFELDGLSGNLTETATREMGADVCCIDAGTIETGKSRSLLAAIGGRDQTVKIVSLEPGAKMLQQKSSLALKSRPHSVSLQASPNGQDMILMIGLEDGSSLKASVDPITGAIGTSPTRRFLGARPVSVGRMPLDGHPAMLLLSSRPWMSRIDHVSGKHSMVPLSYAPLDHGCAFSSEAVPEGLVATAGKTLRIISIDTAAALEGSAAAEEETFHSNKVPLRYTPRQMTLLSSTTAATGDVQQRKVVLACVESDYDDYGLEEKTSMGFDPQGAGTTKAAKNKEGEDDAMDMDEDSDDEEAAAAKKEPAEDEEQDEEDEDEKAARQTPIRGPRPPGPGHWGSCVRLMDPSEGCRTLDCIEMHRNEAALCCCSVRFHTRGGESLLAVGTVTGLKMNPMKYTASHVLLYRVIHGDRLQLLHRTSVDDGPVLCLAHFQGRLLVGLGKTLRLYEMGKRQLLRKCELRGLPTYVKTLQTAGDRAYVGDMMRSLHFVRYEASSNRLVLIAHDPSPRPIVCQELLDFNTVAVADKFGNICVLRLPRGADTNAGIDVTGQRALWDSSKTDATAKLEVLCQYYVGEVVTGMTRSSLVAGGAESLIYVTVTGRIGALVPFTSRDDVEFYTQLEGYLRTEAPRPTGRDPHAYRSYYAPVMHVVDGNLCDAFHGLSHEEQSKIAERLDRSVGEILKKLEDTRNSLL